VTARLRCDVIDFACRPPIKRNHRCILHQNISHTHTYMHTQITRTHARKHTHKTVICEIALIYVNWELINSNYKWLFNNKIQQSPTNKQGWKSSLEFAKFRTLKMLTQNTVQTQRVYKTRCNTTTWTVIRKEYITHNSSMIIVRKGMRRPYSDDRQWNSRHNIYRTKFRNTVNNRNWYNSTYVTELQNLTHWHTQTPVRRSEPSMLFLLILAFCQ